VAVKQLIERVELTSSASSITFSSIPQTFAHLIVVASARNTLDNYLEVYPNGVTTDRNHIQLKGDGATVDYLPRTRIAMTCAIDTRTANTFGNSTLFISNYTSSADKLFSMDGVEENNAEDSDQDIITGIWNPTPAVAISSLEIRAGSGGNLMSNSTFSLYGITRGGDGTVTTA